jgi:peptide/nickel transport system substrate-binding protein
MKKTLSLMTLSFLIIISLILTSCANITVTTPISSAPINTDTVTTSQATNSAATTTSQQANWWDSFGTPQYGGTLTIRAAADTNITDPATNYSGLFSYVNETLLIQDWKLDRKSWPFTTIFTPPEYWQGLLAESWEMPDPQTVIFHLHQGILWQDKAPMNGRELTAYDIEKHYDRFMGTGNGYTAPIPKFSGMVTTWEKATATDKYTLTFKFKTSSALNFATLTEQSGQNFIESPELAQQGTLTDWKNAVGTGPFVLDNYIQGSEAVFIKNQNYWGNDERHSENQLPYIDKFRLMVIQDIATALAATRTGQIDLLTDVPLQNAQVLTKTNPELVDTTYPGANQGSNLRNDIAPFSDIKVRMAMNLAIDRKSIANNIFGGTVDGIPSGTVSSSIKGWNYPYKEWSQDLKDGYSYNPTKAKQLLSEAGYPQGFKTSVIAGPNSNFELVQIVKAELMDVGIDMEINTMDQATWTALANSRKYEMAWSGTTASTLSPQIAINSYYSKTGNNYSVVKDQTYDDIIDKFNASSSLDDSKQLSIEADKYYLEHYWDLVTFPTLGFTFYQPYLKGFSGEYVAKAIAGGYWARLWIDQDTKKQMGR